MLKLRFSLKTLLVATTACAILVGVDQFASRSFRQFSNNYAILASEEFDLPDAIEIAEVHNSRFVDATSWTDRLIGRRKVLTQCQLEIRNCVDCATALNGDHRYNTFHSRSDTWIVPGFGHPYIASPHVKYDNW